MKPFGNPISINEIQVGNIYQILYEERDLLAYKNGFITEITNNGILINSEKYSHHSQIFIKFSNVVFVKPLVIQFNHKYFIHMGEPYNIMFEGIIKMNDNIDKCLFIFNTNSIINNFNYKFNHTFKQTSLYSSLNNVLDIIEPFANNADSRLMLPLMLSNNNNANAAAYDLFANSAEINQYIGGKHNKKKRNRTLKR